MLVSHRKKVIFTKTEMAAGTSVESHFEPYACQLASGRSQARKTNTLERCALLAQGQSNTRGMTFYNYMGAREIRERIGPECWENYYRFTSIREPFDKIVSYFHHLDDLFLNSRFVGLFARRKMHRLIWGLQVPSDGSSVERFRAWVRMESCLDQALGRFYPGFVNDRYKYVIDGESCVDYFIRFENLQAGIEHVCTQLEIPYDPPRLQNLKAGNRSGGIGYADYYDKPPLREPPNDIGRKLRNLATA